MLQVEFLVMVESEGPSYLEARRPSSVQELLQIPLV